MTLIPGDTLISAFGGGETVTLERYSTATSFDAYGDPVVPAPTLTTPKMVVHQATRRQLERLNLDHTQDWRAFYCASELRTANSSGPPDVVQYQGDRWELVELADYNTLGGLWIALGKRIES